MTEVERIARERVGAWLSGESDRFELDAALLGKPDAWEALEMGDPAAYDLFQWIALACALTVDEPTSAPPPPDAIRHAPFEVQLVWFAASSTANDRVPIGRTKIVIAGNDLKHQGLFEMTPEALADELKRRHEYEMAWHITNHTSLAKLAFHDWDGTFEVRWNRGEPTSTIFRFDDEKGRNEKLYVSDFVLRVALGTKWPDDTSMLKKKPDAEWNPVHRRLWELSGFLCAHQGIEIL